MKLSIIFISFLFVYANEIITPIPQNIDYNIQKAKLGKALFFDTRLSKNNDMSCNSCHNLYKGGDDNLRYPIVNNKQIGDINSPTVLNSRFNFTQFWDGSAKNLKEQVSKSITNPIEMSNKFSDIINILKQDDNISKKFYAIYEHKITKDFIVDAIVEFEKALTTPNSNFDKYLNGDSNAISQDEKDGFSLFKYYGCIACHNGVNIGGNLYQKASISMENMDKNNLGRYNITKDEFYKYYFKVPSLRNISKTSPYFHTGNTKDLKSAITIMFKYQLGVEPSKKDVDKIYIFLKTLDGKLPNIIRNDNK
jgi:cytochrome c peroxidase